jgi:hypothetical protein
MNWERAAILTLTFLVFFSRPTIADEGSNGSLQQIRPCSEWGTTLWGLSYHTPPKEDYNNLNVGFGMRCYTSIRWKWFGNADHHNRIFIQSDVIRDSHYGTLVPLSIGTEYTLMTFSKKTSLLMDAAFTAAYYGFKAPVKSQVRVGPVPAFAVRHRNIQTNVTLVPRAQKNPLAAVTGSVTILFGKRRDE